MALFVILSQRCPAKNACHFDYSSCWTTVLRTWAGSGEWYRSPVLSLHRVVSPGSRALHSAENGFGQMWSLKTIISHFQFSFGSLSKTTETCSKTFYSRFLGKGRVTTELLWVARVPSWFQCRVRVAVCKYRAVYVGQDPVPAATQRLGCGGTPLSVCCYG